MKHSYEEIKAHADGAIGNLSREELLGEQLVVRVTLDGERYTAHYEKQNKATGDHKWTLVDYHLT